MAGESCELCRLHPDQWLLGFTNPDPAREAAREALLASGNGYQMTRGAAPETDADAIHYPATYVAGVYNRLVSRFAGRSQTDESLVRMPNWLPITFRHPDGPWFPGDSFRITHQHQVLDLRRGIHRRALTFRDHAGRDTHVYQEWFTSMARPHLSCMRTVVTALNWSGPLQIRSLIDGRVDNGNVAEYAALASQHLTGLESGHYGDQCWLAVQTTQSQVRIALAARVSVPADAGYDGGRRPVTGPGYVGHELDLTVRRATPLVTDKIVSLYTSRDPATTGVESPRVQPGVPRTLAPLSLQPRRGLGGGPAQRREPGDDHPERRSPRGVRRRPHLRTRGRPASVTTDYATVTGRTPPATTVESSRGHRGRRAG
ncbi:hypothetical protein [Micromonospora tulbaghiae]|uniref:hypothetical protein n=1 Tax=Micromonospora tulbaghiae TaxID=479978 RepID=UPI003F53FE6F